MTDAEIIAMKRSGATVDKIIRAAKPKQPIEVREVLVRAGFYRIVPAKDRP